MNFDRAIALNEIRYAERLCQRTARMYRRAQMLGVFASALAGTAALAAAAQWLPAALAAAGALLMAVVGAGLLAARPGDKALQNEADVKRYAQLRAASVDMTDAEFERALWRARELDAPEVEALRDVAWNDVVCEIGRPELATPLRITQRALAALA
jgi:nicotinic acid phosphoribosyltransferase